MDPRILSMVPPPSDFISLKWSSLISSISHTFNLSQTDEVGSWAIHRHSNLFIGLCLVFLLSKICQKRVTATECHA